MRACTVTTSFTANVLVGRGGGEGVALLADDTDAAGEEVTLALALAAEEDSGEWPNGDEKDACLTSSPSG